MLLKTSRDNGNVNTVLVNSKSEQAIKLEERYKISLHTVRDYFTFLQDL